MVWSYFSASGVGHHVKIDGITNAGKYSGIFLPKYKETKTDSKLLLSTASLSVVNVKLCMTQSGFV